MDMTVTERTVDMCRVLDQPETSIVTGAEVADAVRFVIVVVIEKTSEGRHLVMSGGKRGIGVASVKHFIDGDTLPIFQSNRSDHNSSWR